MIRSTMTGVITVALLLGSTLGVAAQDDPPARRSYFTGELHPGTVVAEEEATVVGDVRYGRGWTVKDERLEVSDPRVSGSVSRVENFDQHKLSNIELVVFVRDAWRIENADGAWSGSGSALVHEGRGIDRDEETRSSTVVLTGEGAYEGLTAYLLVDWTEEPFMVEGAVFVGEAPPPLEPLVGTAFEANN